MAGSERSRSSVIGRLLLLRVAGALGVVVVLAGTRGGTEAEWELWLDDNA